MTRMIPTSTLLFCSKQETFMNRIETRTYGLLLVCALLALPGLGRAVGLDNPPVPLNVAAIGMGEAVVADGNFFNGTAYNPAVLANGPYAGEVGIGFNASNNIFNNIGNYLSGGTTALTPQSFDAGAAFNIALKFDDHWGFQAYNYTRGLFQMASNGSVETESGPAYADTVALGTYSFEPFEDEVPLTVGVNLKLVDQRTGFIGASGNPGDLSGFASQFPSNLRQDTFRWGVDLGVLYDLTKEVAVGLSALDLLHSAGTTFVSPGNPLNGINLDPAPVVVKFGICLHPIKPFVLNIDLDDLFSDTSYYQGQSLGYHLKAGFTYDLLHILVLRAGYSNENPSVGGGLPFLGLDYAYAVDDLTQVYTHFLQFKALL
jgi:hypothetical protein